ncbi:MAG: 3'-5' exonuclease, partial [Thermodesulfobacteriota bacterium]
QMETYKEYVSEERGIEFIFTFDNDATVWREKEASNVSKRIMKLHEQCYSFRDIAVISRSTTNMYMLENALRNYQIPFYSSSGSGFFGKQEIRDVAVFINYLLNPKDKISEASVLRSLFYGASDEELLAYCTNQNSVESINEYLDYVNSLRKKIISLTPLSIIDFILEKTSYDAALLALPDGNVRYANIKKLINIFGRLESLGYGINDVLEYIDLNVFEDKEPLAQVELDEEDSVKILTVHKSKGLEFPVVILADLNHGTFGMRENVMARRGDGFLVRHEFSKSDMWESINELENKDTLEEEKRALYVAKTRAKELLIISFGGQKKSAGKVKVNRTSFARIFDDVFETPSDFVGQDFEAIGFKIPIWRPDNSVAKFADDEKVVETIDVNKILTRLSKTDKLEHPELI